MKDKPRFDIYTIGVFLLSLALTIVLCGSGVLSWLATIPFTLIIMGVWGVFVGIYYFNKDREMYNLGWAVVITSIGILWMINLYIPGYELYLFATFLLIIALLIIISTKITM